jgi:hypothetical protein
MIVMVGVYVQFDQIDANCDGVISWKEFNTYIIESGLLVRGNEMFEESEYEVSQIFSKLRCMKHDTMHVYVFMCACGV